MATSVVTQAEGEVTRFLVGRPTPEAIIAFHPSLEVSERFYELQEIERERELGAEEREEIETYMYLEHFIRLLKAEAHLQLQQRAS